MPINKFILDTSVFDKSIEELDKFIRNSGGPSKIISTDLRINIELNIMIDITDDFIDPEPFRHVVGWRLMKIKKTAPENEKYIAHDMISRHEIFGATQNMKDITLYKKVYEFKIESDTHYSLFVESLVWNIDSKKTKHKIIDSTTSVRVFDGQTEKSEATLNFKLDDNSGTESGYWGQYLDCKDGVLSKPKLP